MKRTKQMLFFTTCLGAALVGLPALADTEGDKKKAEKEWKKAEERQKKGGNAPGAGGKQRGMMENPLEDILKLMEEVEGRLFDSDTGKFTQEEQRKIVEAMRFEDKTKSKLDELIKKVEKQQQQMQQQQKQQQQRQRQKQRQKQQQQGKKTPEQMRKERERQRREKELERQRRAQKKKQQQQKQKPNNGQKHAKKQKRQSGEPPKDSAGAADRAAGAGGRWGSLPSKLFQDAANAAKHKAPGRWSDLIKRYRSRLSDAEK